MAGVFASLRKPLPQGHDGEGGIPAAPVVLRAFGEGLGAVGVQDQHKGRVGPPFRPQLVQGRHGAGQGEDLFGIGIIARLVGEAQGPWRSVLGDLGRNVSCLLGGFIRIHCSGGFLRLRKDSIRFGRGGMGAVCFLILGSGHVPAPMREHPGEQGSGGMGDRHAPPAAEEVSDRRCPERFPGKIRGTEKGQSGGGKDKNRDSGKRPRHGEAEPGQHGTDRLRVIGGDGSLGNGGVVRVRLVLPERGIGRRHILFRGSRHGGGDFRGFRFIALRFALIRRACAYGGRFFRYQRFGVRFVPVHGGPPWFSFPVQLMRRRKGP